MALIILFLIGCTAGQIQPYFPSNFALSATSSVAKLMTPSPIQAVTYTEVSPAVDGKWKLVFADEFDGIHLNAGNWVRCYWWANNGCTIASNNEMEWYQPDNVSIRDGNLVLEARAQPVKGVNGNIYPYSSGMVSSGRATSDMTEAPRFSFQYGYVEIRAKIPAGQGLWPAFWMLPVSHDSRPEIDILEILGHEPSSIKFYYHYIDSENEKADSGGEWVGPDFSKGWHIFGLDWEPDRIVWYVDGIKRFEFTEVSAIPSEPMYIILNLAVGGDWPGPPDRNTVFPSQFQVDYVRVFQRGD